MMSAYVNINYYNDTSSIKDILLIRGHSTILTEDVEMSANTIVSGCGLVF